MSSFYLSKLMITGINKKDSIIEFKPGLNIVCGASNIGKSYVLDCIDYLFGSSEIRFEENSGYDTISLQVSTEDGDILLSRKLETNKIQVISKTPGIMSGEYSASTNPKDIGISEVWLRLMGIAEEHKIVKNENWQRQRLTWRTFSHTFLVNESAIIQPQSVLFGTQNTSRTATLSALIFLLTGSDFKKVPVQESNAIKEAKRQAVVSYISERLARLSSEKDSLETQLALSEETELQGKIEALLEDIAYVEQEISVAIAASKQLLQETIDTRRSSLVYNLVHL